MTQDLIKEYGEVIHDASYITDNESDIISVGPKLDIALGGGVPEGSLFIMLFAMVTISNLLPVKNEVLT